MQVLLSMKVEIYQLPTLPTSSPTRGGPLAPNSSLDMILSFLIYDVEVRSKHCWGHRSSSAYFDNSMSNHNLCCLESKGLFALSVGQRLCIDFSFSRAKFPTTLHLHLDVACSCYFWFNLFNVDVYVYIVDYSCSLKCIEKI